jgi:hypothetical protein
MTNEIPNLVKSLTELDELVAVKNLNFGMDLAKTVR